jgi:hypothetical protein
LEIRRRSQVLVGGAWDFLFLGEEGEEFTTEDTEETEKENAGIRRRDVIALDRKSPPFAKYAKSGAPPSSVVR